VTESSYDSSQIIDSSLHLDQKEGGAQRLRDDQIERMCQLGAELRAKERPTEHRLVACKQVEEVYELSLEGERGTNGRPRVKPPQPYRSPDYELVDLLDPRDEVLI